MDLSVEKRTSWLERPVLTTLVLNWELVLFATILILAVFTRFYDLEARVMSHDENSHVYYSWLLSRGQGYTHDPITHGPFQFHVVALSYFLFGDNDLTARIPAVLFSIATVAFMWNYRRYLGRAGALVAALLMTISPYMLFYGRYVRNEAFVALWGVVTLYAILRYIETGRHRYLFYLSAATVLHFTTKETAFIYTAQALIFLAFYLLWQLARREWGRARDKTNFLVALMGALLLFAAALAFFIAERPEALPISADGVPIAEDESLDLRLPLPVGALGGAGLVVLAAALYFLLRGFTWARLREERSFDLLVLLSTLVLPMLAPFPVKMLGINPIDYNNTQGMAVTAGFVVFLALVGIGIGLAWKPRLWLLNAALFYAIFTVFYTTVFTNGFGFFTGLVGSLGYWLDQQGVNRGSQPVYYYALIQVPIYEFLPAVGSLLALVLGLRGWRSPAERELATLQDGDPTSSETQETLPDLAQAPGPEGRVIPPVLSLLGYWVVTSLLAYTLAGEKMPWLTVHIALPMILISGWSIGALIDRVNWGLFRERRGWIMAALLPVFLVSLLAAAGPMLGENRPFQGRELAQLRVTTTFVTALATAVLSGAGLFILARPWPAAQFTRVVSLFLLGFLGLLTARAAFRAAYINYDHPTEYLVYAHSAGGVKQALAQIEEISRRTTDGLALQVAYDNETTYPYWWYLRNYPNQHYYGENPSRSLRDMPVILVGDANFGKMEPVVRDDFVMFEYKRLWWPDQDYFGLNMERILNALRDPGMRSAVFQIWLNRDYTRYAQLTGKDMSLPNWEPAAEMRLYVRKDIVARLWNYGSAPVAEEPSVDPYEGKEARLVPEQVIGSSGAAPGELQRPRDLIVLEDGSLFVADTGNHRIQHLSPDGSLIAQWGGFSGTDPAAAPPGTFNEPWGLGMGPDGSIYVADTWNHRVQKFSPDGEFLATWGYFGTAEAPEAFWGPRDVEVDDQGRVFVTDTGNKRIVVFDEQGNYLTQFGQAGLSPGEFDEPTGLAIDDQGRLYVADTWNQRVQVFSDDGSGAFQVVNSWEVVAWFGQSLDNKPYIDVGPDGHVFITDPEGYRVIEFDAGGQIVRYWGDYSAGTDGFGMAGAVAVGPDGQVWVSDAGNSRLLRFRLP